MKPFARFLSPAEYSRILQSLIKEARLRERIVTLQQLRQKGARTLEEAVACDAALRQPPYASRP